MTGAIVLAAGASSRMGRPKALLPVEGTTFLGHVLATLRAAGVSTVRVVLGQHADEIRQHAALRTDVVVINPTPEAGMLSSVRHGVRALPEEVDAFLLWPVDHPTVMPDTVRKLVAAFREGGAPIVVPVHAGRRGHPVLFAARLKDELLRAPDSVGARAVVVAHEDGLRAVEVHDPGVLADVDTPEAYARIVGKPLP
ncbi:MAG TPA: nucleotidyltransferase family protein [Candidatus Polarisedimenticolaceae bacterium]